MVPFRPYATTAAEPSPSTITTTIQRLLPVAGQPVAIAVVKKTSDKHPKDPRDSAAAVGGARKRGATTIVSQAATVGVWGGRVGLVFAHSIPRLPSAVG